MDNQFERHDAELRRRDLVLGCAVLTVAAVANSSPAGAVIWEEGDIQCRAVPPEKEPGYDVDDALLQRFMQISRTLTGMPLSARVDLDIGRQYVQRFSRLDMPNIDFPKLMAAHDKNEKEIMADPAINKAAEQLIYLWYLSAFYLKIGTSQVWVYGTTEQYERSLLWRIIGAHAPMMAMPLPVEARKQYWAKEGHVII